MQNFRDYYQILGVVQTATADELKTAYRRAARRYHPDLNPDDDTAEEKFKEVGEAYDVLSDSDRRSEYDQLTQFLSQKKTGLFSSLKKDSNDYSRFTDFNIFVEYLLNRRGIANVQTAAKAEGKKQNVRPPTQPPSPSRVAAQNTTENSSSVSPIPSASSTVQRPISTRQTSNSTRRSRSAATSASTAKISNSSNSSNSPDFPRSSNHELRSTRSPNKVSPKPSASSTPTFSNFRRPNSKLQTPNPKPSITEAQLTIPLPKAYKGGKERIRLADGRSLTVTLPPAMVSGQKIQVKAHDSSGDELSLLIQVAPHDLFTLKMPDVYCQIPITPSEAVLGGSISVPTLDGLVKMVLTAGACSGQKLRLTGKGYPFNGQRGDQIVELDVKIPTNITLREREVYEKLRRIESFRPRKNLIL